MTLHDTVPDIYRIAEHAKKYVLVVMSCEQQLKQISDVYTYFKPTPKGRSFYQR